MVSGHSESFEVLCQVGTENVPELKELIFLLDDLEPLRDILFNLGDKGDDGEFDYPFKENSITNLSMALNLFNPSNLNSPLTILKQEGHKLAHYDVEKKTNRLERCLLEFKSQSGRNLLDSLKGLKETYKLRIQAEMDYSSEYCIVSCLIQFYELNMELASKEIQWLNEKVSATKKDQFKSIDELWKIILVENETIVPYVHCLNQLQTIEPIEGINVEEALFVFLNISSDIVRHNYLTKQREYRRGDIITAYSHISEEDNTRYHEDAMRCWDCFKTWVELFRDPLKAFSMIECYELDMYADVRKDSWISVADKEKIEKYLSDLQPEESVDLVLDYMSLQFSPNDPLRLEVARHVESSCKQLCEQGEEIAEPVEGDIKAPDSKRIKMVDDL